MDNELKQILKDMDDAFQIFIDMAKTHVPGTALGCRAVVELAYAMDKAKQAIIEVHEKNNPSAGDSPVTH